MSKRRRRPGGVPRGVLVAGRRRPRRIAPLFVGAAIAGVILGSVLYGLRVDDEEQPSATNPANPAAGADSATTPALGGGPLPGASSPATPGGPVAAGGGGTRYAVDLSQPDLVVPRFSRRPRAGLLFDLRTGRVLWRHRPTRRLPIASLTKMMTALLIVEREGPRERVRITREAVRTGGSAVGVLPKGKKVQLEALMNGLLLVSGNDAAVALADYSAGSVRAFVRSMNRRAAELDLSCTHFSTPHGLLDRGNQSCAGDLAALARAAMAKRRIRRIAGRSRAILKFPIKGRRLFLYNNNPLVRGRYPGVTGLKTGYTDRAGRSIVSTAKRGRRQLGVVLLHSYDPARQARSLLDRGFRALRRER